MQSWKHICVCMDAINSPRNTKDGGRNWGTEPAFDHNLPLTKSLYVRVASSPDTIFYQTRIKLPANLPHRTQKKAFLCYREVVYCVTGVTICRVIIGIIITAFTDGANWANNCFTTISSSGSLPDMGNFVKNQASIFGQMNTEYELNWIQN